MPRGMVGSAPERLVARVGDGSTTKARYISLILGLFERSHDCTAGIRLGPASQLRFRSWSRSERGRSSVGGLLACRRDGMRWSMLVRLPLSLASGFRRFGFGNDLH